MSAGSTTGVDIVTWTCWGVVGVVWGAGALLARRHGPPTEKEAGNDAASIGGLVAGIAVLATPHSFWRHLELHTPVLRTVGLVVVVLGAVATVWSRVVLGQMWSSAPVAKQGHALRTTGPYAITRHPIYTWMLVLLLGTAMTQALGRWAALFLMVTVILSLKIRTEEQVLREAFPGEYDRYRERVPALIPLPRRRRMAATWHPAGQLEPTGELGPVSRQRRAE
jgi:protein-S-isoprenylcysteine O-methyltransferase Ste14